MSCTDNKIPPMERVDCNLKILQAIGGRNLNKNRTRWRMQIAAMCETGHKVLVVGSSENEMKILSSMLSEPAKAMLTFAAAVSDLKIVSDSVKLAREFDEVQIEEFRRVGRYAEQLNHQEKKPKPEHPFSKFIGKPRFKQ